MKHPLAFLSFLLVILLAGTALAGGRELATKKFPAEFTALSAGSIASGDFVPVYDASAQVVKKVDATALPLGGAFNGTVGATTPASGAFTTGSFSGAVTFSASGDIPLANKGRDWFNICGEATTVNNNTVYYGPSIVLLASSGNGQTCDINAAGNATEATADAPVYTNQAVYVLGMTCRNEADANADISFTLRTAAGATVPSVTCTIADGERDCVADVQTTTAIAAGATVAIAAASTGDIADGNGFVCTVSVAY